MLKRTALALILAGCLAQLVAYEDAQARGHHHRHCHRAGRIEICPSPKVEIGTAAHEEPALVIAPPTEPAPVATPEPKPTFSIAEWRAEMEEAGFTQEEIAEREAS